MPSQQEVKSFIAKLQSSDRMTKKKWLISGTAVAMIIIVALWSFYIRSAFQALKPASAQFNQISFAEVFNTGAKVFGKEAFSKIKNFFGDAEQPSVSTANFNFVLKNLDPISPKKLP